MNANSPVREGAPLAKAVVVRRRSSRPVPRPPGASVELRHATGTEPELLRHRALLDGVCAVEFPVPKERFAGRGIVICGGGAKYLPSVDVLVPLLPCCMAAIAVEDAIAAVERYLEGHKTSTRQQA